jgi:AcrR family transcriptional regulator
VFLALLYASTARSSGARLRDVTQLTKARAARGERESRIVTEARAIAEADGWPSVTVRRLASAIGYSQPVLYGHFPDGRDGIVRAVAIDGFERLAAALDSAPRSASTAKRVRAIVQRYTRFARENPAVYEAMFSLPTDLGFATEAAPAPLRKAFAAIQRALADSVDDLETETELLWSAMHGLVDLQRHGRLRTSHEQARQRLLTRLFSGDLK